MNVPGTPTVDPDWLALRETADAAARRTDLLPPLVRALPADVRPGRPLVVWDLGCGTGALARWLAVRLPGPQHWILCDRDAALLDLAVTRLPRASGDGSPVTAETWHGDITTLCAAEVIASGAGLVGASALLDVLTAAEARHVAGMVAAAGCPALFTLSVTGDAHLLPSGELDREVAAAFAAHQRRRVAGRGHLLGAAAARHTAAAFVDNGARVWLRSSPWRLGPGESELAWQWMRGWVAAAAEMRPDLAAPFAAYLERRRAACQEGALRVHVSHRDLLALPAAAHGAES